jgi:lipid A 3-O-deacylase
MPRTSTPTSTWTRNPSQPEFIGDNESDAKPPARWRLSIVRIDLKRSIATVVLSLWFPLAALAQQGALTANPHVDGKPIASLWDLGVLVEGGNGLEDRTSFHFLSAGAHLGRILTDDHTALRANFEYAVEAFPLWQSYTPQFQRINCPYGTTLASQCSAPTTTGGTYRGVSIIPIVLRINMNHGGKLQPWLQGAGGLIYTTRKYPPIGSTNYLDPSQTAPNADTSVWNFDPQFGIGAHYFLKPRRSLDLSANAVHISSASLGDKNPGVNTGVQFSLGYSWWK